MPGTASTESWPLCRVTRSRAGSPDGQAETLLEVRCEQWLGDDGETVLVLDGELCHFTAPQAAESMRWLAGTAGTLIIDLAEVTFMDAGGISALVELWKATTDRGATWDLRSPSPNVRWMLELVSLDGTLLGVPSLTS